MGYSRRTKSMKTKANEKKVIDKAVKKAKGTNTLQQMRSFRTPFPNLFKVCLKYNEHVYATPAAISYNYIFNLNGIYDVNQSGTGHQPLYRDDLSSIYNRYRVRYVRYEITISNLGTPCRAVVVAHNNATPPSSVETAIEHPKVKFALVNAVTNGGKTQHKFRGLIDISKLLGEKLTDDRDQAVFGSNPLNIAYMTLMLSSQTGTNINSLNWDVSFKMYTELFDRVPVTGS